jgi:LTXXQ motif family protein/ABC transporter substrate binding protein
VAIASGSAQPAAEVCRNGASDLTDWPIARISEVVQPTEAQRPALDELRSASQKAMDLLKAVCPSDLPSTPTGRLAAMESRVKVMLQAVQMVRPPLERFYQLLSDEQKARLNAVSPGGKSNAEEDQRAFTKFCRERPPAVTDLPFDRIAQAAAELVARTPDVAVAFSNPALAVLKPLAGNIPLVFVGVGDPVGGRFVASLARPGGNITGFASHAPSMGGKWLEVLKETAPYVTRTLAIMSKLKYIRPFGNRSRMPRRDWQSRPQRALCTMPPRSRASSHLSRRGRIAA